MTRRKRWVYQISAGFLCLYRTAFIQCNKDETSICQLRPLEAVCSCNSVRKIQSFLRLKMFAQCHFKVLCISISSLPLWKGCQKGYQESFCHILVLLWSSCLASIFGRQTGPSGFPYYYNQSIKTKKRYWSSQVKLVGNEVSDWCVTGSLTDWEL